MKYLTGLFVTLQILSSDSVFSQTKTQDQTYNLIIGASVFILILLMFIMFFMLSSEKHVYSYERKVKKDSFLRKLSQLLIQGVSVEREKDIMFAHSFDGNIRELDNKIPPWFNLLFYGTIVFAAIYMLNYHVLGSGNVMLDEYAEEIRIANEKREELIRTGALINENTVTLLTDDNSLSSGKKIFDVNCTPCHGPDGGGTVGPNLTDEYWIHGGGIKNVFSVVKEGVPVKGMIAWKTLLNPRQIQEVSSYVLKLQGSKPPTGKPPEGNLWIDTNLTSKSDSLRKDTLIKR